jgi:protein ImuA
MVEQIMNIYALESLARVRPPVALGAEALDGRLGGGLAGAALHEIYGDDHAAAAFGLLLAWRGSGAKPIFWVRERANTRFAAKLYSHGLAELGIPPGTLFLVDAPDTIAALRAGADIARCNAVGAVIIEPIGKAPSLDLTASRRLSLAAQRSGVMTLLIRTAIDPIPSAAHSRWRVASASSTPLAGNAPGFPAFDIKLLRHRGGIAGLEARLEWNRDRQSFDQTPLSGGAPAVAAGRTGQAVERRAA